MARSGLQQVQKWAGNYELHPIHIIADGLATRYASLADDASSSADIRRAAQLVCAAEQQLQIGKCELEKAGEALRLFRDANYAGAVLDALRLVVHCHRLKAEQLALKGDLGGKTAEVIRKARFLAAEQLEIAEEMGDRHGEAAMLLSLAELGFHEAGRESHAEARQRARRAADTFESIAMPRMQALALLVLCRLQCLQPEADYRLAITICREALRIASDLDDPSLLALARHHLVAAQIFNADTQEATDGLQELDTFGSTPTCQRLLASNLARIAEFHIQNDSAAAALSPARKAYTIFQQLQHGHGWEAASLGVLVDALIALGDMEEALHVADEAVKELRERGDERETARAMNHLVHAYVANKLFDKAWQVAEETVELGCQDLSESHSRVVALLTCAHIYLQTDNFKKAADACEKAEATLETLGISHETSSLRHFLKELCVELSRSRIAEAKSSSPEEAKAVDSTTDEEVDEGNDGGTCGDSVDSDSARAHSCLDACSDHMKNGRMQEALKAAEFAENMFADLEDAEGEAKALLAVAAAYIALQQYKKAWYCARTSLEICAELEHFSGQADALHLMACAQNYMEKPHEALPFAQQALCLYRDKLGDAKNAVKMYFVIVDCYDGICTKFKDDVRSKNKKAAESEKALTYATKAAKLAARIDDATDAYAHYYLAHTFMMNGKFKDAAQIAEEAIVLFRSVNDDSGETRSMVMMAEAKLALGDKLKAKSLLDRAVDHATASDLAEELDAINVLLHKLLHEHPPTKHTERTMDEVVAEPDATSTASPNVVSRYVGPDPEIVKSRIAAMVLDMIGGGHESLLDDTPFMDAGVDSLASVELRTNLQQQFGIPLPSTVMFNFPNASTLTAFMVGEMEERQISLK